MGPPQFLSSDKILLKLHGCKAIFQLCIYIPVIPQFPEIFRQTEVYCILCIPSVQIFSFVIYLILRFTLYRNLFLDSNKLSDSFYVPRRGRGYF